jgi:hypothetical protein
MWLLMARAPRPDVPVWPGRHCLAMLDAIAWPGLWAAVIVTAPFGTGIVGPHGLVACRLLRRTPLVHGDLSQRTLSVHDQALGSATGWPRGSWRHAEVVLIAQGPGRPGRRYEALRR